MHNLKLQNKNNQAQTLIDLIAKNRDIADYFRVTTQPSNYQQLAIQLIREGIAHRARNEKHYNVAYVKHNRFLSPPQKDVALKVTEIVPIIQQSVKIYGKPKVKLDDQFLNPIEQAQQYYRNYELQQNERTESQRNLDKHLPPQNNLSQKQRKQKINEKQAADNQRQDQVQTEMDKCLIPKTTQTIGLYEQIKSPQNEKKKKRQPERVNKKQQKMDLKIQSNFKTTMKPVANEKLIEVNSPKNGRHIQTYDEVESKIKFMIDRDKRNKKLQHKLEEQNRKLEKLEQRQERLLLRQYEQSKQINKHSAIPRKQMPCCCSSDEQITSKLLEMKTLQNYSSHKLLSNLHSKISPIKSYKISGNPVYPITSSDSSDSSESEIVVAVR